MEFVDDQIIHGHVNEDAASKSLDYYEEVVLGLSDCHADTDAEGCCEDYEYEKANEVMVKLGFDGLESCADDCCVCNFVNTMTNRDHSYE